MIKNKTTKLNKLEIRQHKFQLIIVRSCILKNVYSDQIGMYARVKIHIDIFFQSDRAFNNERWKAEVFSYHETDQSNLFKKIS